ncbi:DUF4230 domain-containing protein [Longispora sp. NPDC051575]|uniref:DUF4230 domain-containing protein n=1 Tax=Longispora sp. NPDC051575 TaxID=3154943 RepID=UPI00343E6948
MTWIYRKFAKVLVAVVTIALVATGGAWFLNRLDVFGERTTDRSGPVVLKSIRDMKRFVAASGHFEIVIDVQKNTANVPSFLIGTRTIYVAVGDVNAYVDLENLAGPHLVVSADRRSVSVTLPLPEMEKPNIDNKSSYVASQDRGVLTRIGDAFGDNSGRTQELNVMAEERISAAAKASDLGNRAQSNTTATVTALMTSLGFTSVTVTFAKP